MQSILIVEDEKRVADLLKAGPEENGCGIRWRDGLAFVPFK